KPSCRVLVVGNPCNTNALIARSSAGSRLDPAHFFAMTMLDQNRAVTQLAQKAWCPGTAVKNLTVWGNHSPTMYPDFYHASIEGRPVLDVIGDESWLQGDFLKTVQQRGSAVIQARGSSSAASAANAVVDTVRALTTPTPSRERFSVCVPSDGSYGVPEGLIFSFPVRCDGAGTEIVQGVEHNDFAQEKLRVTIEELEKERDAVRNLV
ncbi:MAG: malate dehydrogenase, partial [Planctomycetota bacterium]